MSSYEFPRNSREATRIIGARTPMRRQLLSRVDAIVERATSTQGAGLRGWQVEAVLTDARISASRGHVVALVCRRQGPGESLTPPWSAIRAVALRVVAEEWGVATVVPDVETAAPYLEEGLPCLLDIGIDVISA